MDVERRLQSLYASFNARDIDGVLASMTDDVDWPNAWEGGRVRGKEAVREYWLRQWSEIDPHVEPVSITELSDGTIAVEVHQVIRSLDGDVLNDRRVVHTYEVSDGLLSRMTVTES